MKQMSISVGDLSNTITNTNTNTKSAESAKSAKSEKVSGATYICDVVFSDTRHSRSDV